MHNNIKDCALMIFLKLNNEIKIKILGEINENIRIYMA